jgi:mono/diheme cytochrome c family protein
MYAWFQNPVPAVTPELAQNPWTGSSCAGCHGVNALGGSGPSLAGTSLPFPAFEAVVRRGSEAMPAYSPSEMGDAELGHIYDWLQSRAEVPAAPRTVWVATGCGGCHGPNAEGGSASGLTAEEISYDEFHQVVREGTEGMPAYGPSQISDEELQQVYEWLSEAP